MMDPTIGGLLGKKEGFQDVMGPSMATDANAHAMDMSAHAPSTEQILPPNSPPSASGFAVEKFQNANTVVSNDAILKAQQALHKVLNETAAYANPPKKNKESFANPTMKAKKEMFQGANGDMMLPSANANIAAMEGFQNPASTPFPDAAQPANCYPKNQLAPQELLPADPASKWAAVNPEGAGDISGKNFLSAGALIGVNTIGQSLRNANQQLRSEPPCPQGQVSIWNQSTIEPDLQRRPLEGF
jgi:hypothetical protein